MRGHAICGRTDRAHDLQSTDALARQDGRRAFCWVRVAREDGPPRHDPASHLCPATCAAAAAFANSAASVSGTPAATFAASALTKQSRAPRDEMTSTRFAEIVEIAPSADLSTRPSPPRVTMTLLILGPILDSADAASVRLRMGRRTASPLRSGFTTRARRDVYRPAEVNDSQNAWN
jgi:hypothetical protein